MEHFLYLWLIFQMLNKTEQTYERYWKKDKLGMITQLWKFELCYLRQCNETRFTNVFVLVSHFIDIHLLFLNLYL